MSSGTNGRATLAARGAAPSTSAAYGVGAAGLDPRHAFSLPPAEHQPPQLLAAATAGYLASSGPQLQHQAAAGAAAAAVAATAAAYRGLLPANPPYYDHTVALRGPQHQAAAQAATLAPLMSLLTQPQAHQLLAPPPPVFGQANHPPSASTGAARTPAAVLSWAKTRDAAPPALVQQQQQQRLQTLAEEAAPANAAGWSADLVARWVRSSVIEGKEQLATKLRAEEVDGETLLAYTGQRQLEEGLGIGPNQAQQLLRAALSLKRAAAMQRAARAGAGPPGGGVNGRKREPSGPLLAGPGKRSATLAAGGPAERASPTLQAG